MLSLQLNFSARGSKSKAGNTGGSLVLQESTGLLIHLFPKLLLTSQFARQELFGLATITA